MSLLEKAMLLIKKHEGFRKYPYKDTRGYLTIGWGRCLSLKGITEEEATIMLLNDVNDAYETAKRICFTRGVDFNQLPENAKIVLIDMAFNLGGRLGTFKKFFKELGLGNYKEAAKQMLDSKWAVQVGRRAIELAKMMEECEQGSHS